MLRESEYYRLNYGNCVTASRSVARVAARRSTRAVIQVSRSSALSEESRRPRTVLAFMMDGFMADARTKQGFWVSSDMSSDVCPYSLMRVLAFAGRVHNANYEGKKIVG